MALSILRMVIELGGKQAHQQHGRLERDIADEPDHLCERWGRQLEVGRGGKQSGACPQAPPQAAELAERLRRDVGRRTGPASPEPARGGRCSTAAAWAGDRSSADGNRSPADCSSYLGGDNAQHLAASAPGPPTADYELALQDGTRPVRCRIPRIAGQQRQLFRCVWGCETTAISFSRVGAGRPTAAAGRRSARHQIPELGRPPIWRPRSIASVSVWTRLRSSPSNSWMSTPVISMVVVRWRKAWRIQWSREAPAPFPCRREHRARRTVGTPLRSEDRGLPATATRATRAEPRCREGLRPG